MTHDPSETAARNDIETSQTVNQSNVATGRQVDQAHIASSAQADATHKMIMQLSGADWYATGWQVNQNALQASNQQSSIGLSTEGQKASIGISTENSKSVIGQNGATASSNILKNGADYGSSQGKATADYHSTTVKGSADGFKSTIEAASAGWVVSWETIQAGMQTVVQGVGAMAAAYSASNPYWGGTSINGQGWWVGTGSTMVGGTGYTSWGGTAASNATPSGGHGSAGSVSWAEGGLIESPLFFRANGQLNLAGEAGPELILPLRDKQRMAELLARYLPGVHKFAEGGITGGSTAAMNGTGYSGDNASIQQAIEDLWKPVLINLAKYSGDIWNTSVSDAGYLWIDDVQKSGASLEDYFRQGGLVVKSAMEGASSTWSNAVDDACKKLSSISIGSVSDLL